MSPDTLSVVLRALSFVALLQAAGIAIFVALFGSYVRHSQTTIRQLGVWSAVVAAPLLIGQYLLEPARMAGDLTGIFDPSLQRLAMRSPVAATLAARMVGLALIAVTLARGKTPRPALLIAGGLVVALSFSLMGHTAVHPARALLAPALTAHAFIAAFWFGALPALYVATAREPPEGARRLIDAFSRLAIWLVPGLALAGLVMAAVLVRRLAVFGEPYGWLLLAKAVGFGTLMALAAANRARLGPAVALGRTRAFKQSLVAEYALIAAVLAATAVMTALYSPDA